MAVRRTFVKTIDGQEVVTYATSPSAAVRLRFNGWREQREQAAPPPPPPAEPKPATRASVTAKKPVAEPAVEPAVEPDAAK